jgi:hypothetical protein
MRPKRSSHSSAPAWRVRSASGTYRACGSRSCASGRLPEGYRHGVGGFDELLTDSLGIDNAGFVAYIENEKPSYLQLEAWVKEHARNLTPESVAAFNHTILTRDMNAEKAGERRERFGIADPTFAHGVSLNDFDDWDQAHRRVTNSAARLA